MTETQVYYFPEGPAESKGTASDNMYTTVIRVNGEPWDNAPPTPEKLKPDSPVLGASDPITEPEVSTAPGHDKKSFCWRHRTLLTALNLALLFLALTAAGVAIYFVLYNQQADPVAVVSDQLDEVKSYVAGIVDDCIAIIDRRLEAIKANITAHNDTDYSGLHRNPFLNVQILQAASGPAYTMGIPALVNIEILKHVKYKFGYNKAQMEYLLQLLPPLNELTDGSVLNGQLNWCPHATEVSQCDPKSRYRTIDGSCNNLQHPLWGQALRPLRRWTTPDYGDGFNTPRKGRDGVSLPEVRKISAAIFQSRPARETSPAVTVSNMVFGQFLAHDTAKTAITMNPAADGGTTNVRCGGDGCSTLGHENEACFPMNIPNGDPNFRGVKQCLKFVRSEAVTSDDCSLSTRMQLNQLTSWIDLSIVYGSSDAELEALRDTDDPARGRLRVTEHPSDPALKPLLPQKDNVPSCMNVTEEIKCFIAGDARVNEQVGLTAIHTVFHRYHNVLEDALYALHPDWKGEELFQEARHINIAIWQNIVYAEYLPVVVGPEAMRKYDLDIRPIGTYDKYDPSINAETSDVFQTAAFRFGHSQVPGSVKFVDQTFSSANTFHLSEVTFHPKEMYSITNPGGSSVDGLLLYQANESAPEVDAAFTTSITRSLFALSPPRGLGSDLPSINTQRGRDHGTPGYLVWREWCDLSKDLSDISEDLQRELTSLYHTADDIDVFVGGMAERPVRGGLVGPLFACIIAHQFHAYKVGDRFWFERSDPIIGFTEAQRQEIRLMTLAQVQCQTMDTVLTLQKYVQLQPLSILYETLLQSNREDDLETYLPFYVKDSNERRRCEDLPNINMTLWADNR